MWRPDEPLTVQDFAAVVKQTLMYTKAEGAHSDAANESHPTDRGKVEAIFQQIHNRVVAILAANKQLLGVYDGPAQTPEAKAALAQKIIQPRDLRRFILKVRHDLFDEFFKDQMSPYEKDISDDGRITKDSVTAKIALDKFIDVHTVITRLANTLTELFDVKGLGGFHSDNERSSYESEFGSKRTSMRTPQPPLPPKKIHTQGEHKRIPRNSGSEIPPVPNAELIKKQTELALAERAKANKVNEDVAAYIRGLEEELRRKGKIQ